MDTKLFIDEVKTTLKLSDYQLEEIKRSFSIRKNRYWYCPTEYLNAWGKEYQEFCDKLKLSTDQRKTLQQILAKHLPLEETGFEDKFNCYKNAKTAFLKAWGDRLRFQFYSIPQRATGEIASYLCEKYGFKCRLEFLDIREDDDEVEQAQKLENSNILRIDKDFIHKLEMGHQWIDGDDDFKECFSELEDLLQSYFGRIFKGAFKPHSGSDAIDECWDDGYRNLTVDIRKLQPVTL